LLLWSATGSLAQEAPVLNTPRIYFPYPMGERKWHMSIGLTSFTTPRDVTEEVRIRAPSIDFHALRKISGSFYLDGRVLSQVLQNHVSVGLRWARPLSNRISFSVGDDAAFWFGFLKVGGFNNKAYGWINYPNVSLGYRVRDNLLLTFKTEAVINLYDRSYTGTNVIEYTGLRYNGLAFLFTHEQPLFKRQYLTLGVRFLYTDFNWQLWSLYETFDRKIFYPELLIGFML